MVGEEKKEEEGKEKKESERELLRNIKCCHKSKDNPEDRRSIFVQIIDIHL